LGVKLSAMGGLLPVIIADDPAHASTAWHDAHLLPSESSLRTLRAFVYVRNQHPMPLVEATRLVVYHRTGMGVRISTLGKLLSESSQFRPVVCFG
jgi:hypothetical protein